MDNWWNASIVSLYAPKNVDSLPTEQRRSSHFDQGLGNYLGKVRMNYRTGLPMNLWGRWHMSVVPHLATMVHPGEWGSRTDLVVSVADCINQWCLSPWHHLPPAPSHWQSHRLKALPARRPYPACFQITPNHVSILAKQRWDYWIVRLGQ